MSVCFRLVCVCEDNAEKQQNFLKKIKKFFLFLPPVTSDEFKLQSNLLEMTV